MYSYVKDFDSIRELLVDFLRHGIDTSKLDLLDHVIESSEIDQIRILNSYCSLAEQRVLFGTAKNISNVIKAMKEKLKTAQERYENPTTIELSLELMQSLSNIAPYIDDFMNKGVLREPSRINEFSRILYRKANRLGFYPDIDTQLKDANIPEEEARAFVEKLNENIELEMMENEDEPSQ